TRPPPGSPAAAHVLPRRAPTPACRRTYRAPVTGDAATAVRPDLRTCPVSAPGPGRARCRGPGQPTPQLRPSPAGVPGGFSRYARNAVVVAGSPAPGRTPAPPAGR